MLYPARVHTIEKPTANDIDAIAQLYALHARRRYIARGWPFTTHALSDGMAYAEERLAAEHGLSWLMTTTDRDGSRPTGWVSGDLWRFEQKDAWLGMVVVAPEICVPGRDHGWAGKLARMFTSHVERETPHLPLTFDHEGVPEDIWANWSPQETIEAVDDSLQLVEEAT